MQDECVPSETTAPFGFIMIRHVNSKATDFYWKESYNCIRKWYDDPILIIDDNSNPDFLHDNMVLVHCNIIYDKEWKGSGEMLGYYYLHKLKPFNTAVIIHDSVFIQKRVSFDIGKANMKFLWTITNLYDYELESYYHELCHHLPIYKEITHIYGRKSYKGCFGLMSVITWNFVDQLARDGLFETLQHMKGRRLARCSMERMLGIMAFRRDPTIQSMYNEIHFYMKWQTTFMEYLNGTVGDLDIVKVWTGR